MPIVVQHGPPAFDIGNVAYLGGSGVAQGEHNRVQAGLDEAAAGRRLSRQQHEAALAASAESEQRRIAAQQEAEAARAARDTAAATAQFNRATTLEESRAQHQEDLTNTARQWDLDRTDRALEEKMLAANLLHFLPAQQNQLDGLDTEQVAIESAPNLNMEQKALALKGIRERRSAIRPVRTRPGTQQTFAERFAQNSVTLPDGRVFFEDSAGRAHTMDPPRNTAAEAEERRAEQAETRRLAAEAAESLRQQKLAEAEEERKRKAAADAAKEEEDRIKELAKAAHATWLRVRMTPGEDQKPRTPPNASEIIDNQMETERQVRTRRAEEWRSEAAIRAGTEAPTEGPPTYGVFDSVLGPVQRIRDQARAEAGGASATPPPVATSGQAASASTPRPREIATEVRQAANAVGITDDAMDELVKRAQQEIQLGRPGRYVNLLRSMGFPIGEAANAR